MRLGLLAISVIALCAACGRDPATSPLTPTSPTTPAVVIKGTFVSATMATGVFQVTTTHAFPADPMSACSQSVQVTWVVQKGA